MKKNRKILFILAAFCIAGCSKVETPAGDSGMTRETVPICRTGMTGPPPAETVPVTKAEEQDKYIIPVVFHVFGKEQGSGTIDVKRMEKVIEWINNDFHGIRNKGDFKWFETVVPEFDNVKENFPEVEFRLAKYDPKGKKTDGVCFHPAAERFAGGPGYGFGDYSGANYVKKYAWDNSMYMNVYITTALYGRDGYESGVSWYPDVNMTNNDLARVVYNGAFLPGGDYYDTDFTSVITHEFGHFFNLIHTFEGLDANCANRDDDGTTTGDMCPDTPHVESASTSITYRNCWGQLTNFQNYMNYGDYCNFTHDQIARMVNAMHHPARKSLWSKANLKKTLGIGAEDEEEVSDPNVKKYGYDIVIKGSGSLVPSMLEGASMDIFTTDGFLLFTQNPYSGELPSSQLKKGTYYYVQKKDSAVIKGSIEII